MTTHHRQRENASRLQFALDVYRQDQRVAPWEYSLFDSIEHVYASMGWS